MPVAFPTGSRTTSTMSTCRQLAGQLKAEHVPTGYLAVAEWGNAGVIDYVRIIQPIRLDRNGLTNCPRRICPAL